MAESNSKQTLRHVIFILLFALAAMSSSFYNGITFGNDSHQHYQFAHTIYSSIVTGELYPSFDAASNNGYGDVGLRFYPPFAYYFLSLFFLLIGNWYAASLTVFTLIFFGGGVGVYFWTKEEFSSSQSLLAAGLYIFAPHHLNQLYNGSLVAEFTASAIIPFCFFYLTRVCRKGKIQDVLGLSIFYALLILTHLPSTIMGSIVFLIYSLFLLEKKSAFRTLLKLTTAIGCALGASSFYWLRMVTELNWVNHSDKIYFEGLYDYRVNFLFTPQNILDFINDSSVLWLGDLMLLAVLLVSIFSLVFLYRRRKRLGSFTRATTGIFFTSVFLATPLSKIIWDNFSLLQKVQFPWRWLGIISVSGAVFASIGINRVSEKMKQSRNLLLPIGVGSVFLVFVIVSSFIMKEASFVSAKDFNEAVDHIAATPGFDCWLPIWSKRDALQTSEKIVSGERGYKILKWNTLEREFQISPGASGYARIATFYYPHWKATVNGEQVPTEIAKDGAILIFLTEKDADVRLVFYEPYVIKIAYGISLFVWCIFIIGVATSLFKAFPEFKSSRLNI